MSAEEPESDLRARLEDALRAYGASATPQALGSLVHSLNFSSPEVAGDSDSLLVGLLRSGSYTLDLLRDAGADTDFLSEESADSSAYPISPYSPGEVDSLASLFGESGAFSQVLERALEESRPIEASDLLQQAISPTSDRPDISSEGYELGQLLRQSSASAPAGSAQRLLQDLERTVASALLRYARYVWTKPVEALLSARGPMTRHEAQKLRNLRLLDAIERRHIEHAINQFIVTKRLPVDYEEFVYISLATSPLNIASNQFLNGGGNYRDLSTALSVSSRFAPERDQPILGLFERDGRVLLQHFTYRGTGILRAEQANDLLSVSSTLLLPLIPESVLREFEALINRQDCRELDIQRFLERYPEVLKSLGYASCSSQVVLSEPGRSDLIPDFILHRPGGIGFDILDLKLPTAQIVRSNPYVRASSNISKAVAQLHAYREYFRNPVNRSHFIKKTGIDYLEPNLIVAIGRQEQYQAVDVRATIEAQSSGVRVLTYDELIAYAKVRSLSFR